MGAIGAVGGIGGGLGSGGGSDAGFDAGAAAAAYASMRLDTQWLDAGPSQGSTEGWYDSGSVMGTPGDVDDGQVRLDDGDLGNQYVMERNRFEPGQFPRPTVGDSPQVPQGVGDSPAREVVDRVAAVYAANVISSTSRMW